MGLGRLARVFFLLTALAGHAETASAIPRGAASVHMQMLYRFLAATDPGLDSKNDLSLRRSTNFLNPKP